MFELSMPWWEYPLRAVIVYAVLLLLLRVSGKRSVGEFTTFDLLVVMLLSESAQNALVADDKSILGGMIVAATLLVANYAVAWASARSARVDRLVEGEPVLLARNGRVLEGALRANNVPRSDFDEAMRRANCAALDEVEQAVLETSGEITIVTRRNKD